MQQQCTIPSVVNVSLQQHMLKQFAKLCLVVDGILEQVLSQKRNYEKVPLIANVGCRGQET